MKKIVTMMIIILGVMSLQAKTKDPFHFIVEGSFLQDKSIKYTIFEDTGKGIFQSIKHAKAYKSYQILCDVGCKYIVRFENKKGDVKFLMIFASTSGYFQADVDWDKPYDGLIKKEKIGYCLTALTNGDRPTSLAQN